MTSILIYDNHCRIEDEPDIEFLRELDKELSFFVQGAEHTKAFKGYIGRGGKFVKWDGRKHLLSSSLEFGPGLLNRVCEIYDTSEKLYHIVDNRTLKSEVKPINIDKKLKKIKKEPYPYQIEAANEILKHQRGIIKMPTGSGKTLVLALIAAALGKKTIVYVIGKDLLYQVHDLFTSLFGKVGIIGDGKCEIYNINVATIWTINQALGLKVKRNSDELDGEKKISKDKYDSIKAMLNDARVHLIDECQICASDTIQLIHNNIFPEHVYGLSASPYRDDNADLLIESILGSVVVDISASSLIDKGYLVKPIIKFIKVPKANFNEKHYSSIYSKYIVNNDVRNDLIINAAIDLVGKGYKPLILYSKLDHGKILYDKLSEYLDCILLSGKDTADDRNIAKTKITNGDIKCIIASTIFDIGVDIPALSGLVIGSAGKSSIRALQRIGRVIRKYENKKMAAIVDFYDQAKFLDKHSLKRKHIYASEDAFTIHWPK